MRFAARSTEEGYEAKVWLDEPSLTIRFVLPENNLDAWQCALEKAQQEPWFVALERALTTETVAFLLRFPMENQPEQDAEEENDRHKAVFERLTFTRLLLACKRLSDPKHHTWPAFSQILQKNVALQEFWNTPPFSWMCWPGNVPIDLSSDESIIEAFRASLLMKLEWQKKEKQMTDEQFLGDFLPNMDLWRALIADLMSEKREQLTEIMQGYGGIVMALLDYLDGLIDRFNQESPSLEQQMLFERFARRYRHHLLALLIENETLSLERRQEHLADLLTCRISEEERWQLVKRILTDLEEEAINDAARYVAETMASLMAEHYLRRYALDEAIQIWEKVQHLKRDGWLKGMLVLYRFAPAAWIVSLTWLFSACLLPPPWKTVSVLLGLAALFVVILAGIFGILGRFWNERGFSALELFLPRLAGAVFVGLSILALENTVWQVSAQLPLLSWGFLSIAAFVGALAYIFLDVHKNTRLLPLSLEAQKAISKGASVMKRSIQTSWRIFCIGAVEALGLTTVVASFLPLDQELMLATHSFWQWQGFSINIVEQLQGVVIDWSPYLHLTFLPKIILLWAGLALLLGAFAQLLWQDRQITAS